MHRDRTHCNYKNALVRNRPNINNTLNAILAATFVYTSMSVFESINEKKS